MNLKQIFTALSSKCFLIVHLKTSQKKVVQPLGGITVDLNKEVTYTILNPHPSFCIKGADVATTGVPLDREQLAQYTVGDPSNF